MAKEDVGAQKLSPEFVKQLSSEIASAVSSAVSRTLGTHALRPRDAGGYNCTGDEFECLNEYHCHEPHDCTGKFGCPGTFICTQIFGGVTGARS
jgi:hypothetical protein